jgi:glycosyltransferase involved in cell wall biosynthesis
MSQPPPAVLLLGDTLSLGGTEGQFAELAVGLDRARWDLRVACIRAEGPLRARLERAGLSPRSLGPASFKSPELAPVILRLAGYLRRQAVRLVHCFDFYSNLLGVPAARLARTPVVIASQRDMGDLRSRGQQAIHALALRLATHVLVNSDAIAARLRQAGRAREDRLTVIRNGVDLARFAPAGTANGSEPVMVATLANLRPEKGLVQLVEAAAIVARRCPRARFSLWGDGPLRSHLEGLIAARNLGGIVALRGATPTPEEALRECHVFVLASLSEASSNVILEAMATGVPVVATRVGGTPDLVEDRQTGLLVPPADPPALAEAILDLLDTPGRAARMGAEGRRRALEFGMDRLIERTDALYCRALGPARGAPAPREAIQRT